jgi:hypothetical protein
VTDATGPKRTFGWNSNPINRHTLRFAGVCSILIAFAITALIAERDDRDLILFAWTVLLITLVVFGLKIRPWLTTRDPVVEIGPDGLIDRRKLAEPLPWRYVSALEPRVGGIYVRVRALYGRRVRKRGPGRWWRATGLGLGSFVINLATIEAGGEDIDALCRENLKASRRALIPAVIAALEHVEASGLQGRALDDFIEAVRDVPMRIPLFEQQRLQGLDIVEEVGGQRAMHVFTDSQRYEAAARHDYYYPQFLDWMLWVAPTYRLDAIVINPGVGPECRIESDRFAEFAERLQMR